MMAFSRELVITVPDMSCEHCREAVTRALTGVEGVGDVDVDLEAKLVIVGGDAAIVSEDVREAIAAAGYTPTLRSP